MQDQKCETKIKTEINLSKTKIWRISGINLETKAKPRPWFLARPCKRFSLR